MKLGDIVDIAASGMVAQRARMATTASNLANAFTTRSPEGGPYQRRDPIFAPQFRDGAFASRLDRAVAGVRVRGVAVDPGPGLRRLDPGHPDADDEGFVTLPNVSIPDEVANMMSASRSFEANLVVLRKARDMSDAVLQVGR